MIFVRYADDLVVGFEYQAYAERFLQEFQERLAKFGLEVHLEKTRLIEFGRLARWRRKQRAKGEPENFPAPYFPSGALGELNRLRDDATMLAYSPKPAGEDAPPLPVTRLDELLKTAYRRGLKSSSS